MKEGENQYLSEEHAHRTAYLVAGYLRQTLTEAEHDELDEWLTASEENQLLFEELTDPDFIEKGFKKMEGLNKEKVLSRIKSKISFSKMERKKRRRNLFPYSIAASILLLAGIFVVYNLMKKRATTHEIADKQTIKPGGNYAMLTLGNGQTINLQEAKNGLIDSTNGIEVLKTSDGQLSYENVKSANEVYHTITTPTGGQYSVLLPDSTRVWLNSSSSLKYPVVFNGNERIVELTGEGYFEVKKLRLTFPGLTATPSGGGYERSVPFIVKVKGVVVEVVGTHFNVNAYDDEATINTTLIEGKVIVRSSELGVESRELSPGEEAKIDKNGRIEVNNVETEEVVAWKNGQFMFKDAPIENIMRQVARWYDAEVIYKGKVLYHFNATIYRKESVEKLLQILEETDEVHFKIEGRKIVVRP